jgi:tetratricopeptide (TPR) repeat protein
VTHQGWGNELAKSCLALAHIHAGRYQRGRALAETRVADEEIWVGPAWPLRQLGWVALAEEKYAEALAFSQRSLAFYRPERAGEPREHHAWSQATLGRALHGLGRHVEAKRELYEALQTCVEMRAFLPLMHLMPIIPVVLVDDEDAELKERAVELYALAESLPFVANSRLFEDIAGQHIRKAAVSLPLEVVEAAQARGQALDWWETAAELLEELPKLGWTD